MLLLLVVAMHLVVADDDAAAADWPPRTLFDTSTSAEKPWPKISRRPNILPSWFTFSTTNSFHDFVFLLALLDRGDVSDWADRDGCWHWAGGLLTDNIMVWYLIGVGW
jgi:hypothetical protein